MREVTRRGWVKNILIPIIYSIACAAIISLLRYSVTPDTYKQKFELTSYTSSMVSGGMVGFLLNLVLSSKKTIEDADDKFTIIISKLLFQENAIELLMSGSHHNTIKCLLDSSIKDQCKKIALVDEDNYIKHLINAVRESKKYNGVQRNTVSWFNDGANEHYLNVLRNKKMSEKIRIFLINDDEEESMLRELEDEEQMKKYWNNTGNDVDTYWVTETNFKGAFLEELSIPFDFALYDDKLLIKYDDRYKTLEFDMIQDSESFNESRIFEKLKQRIGSGNNNVFVEIHPI